MTLTQLKESFYRQVHPSRPNEWEVEEVLEPLLDLDSAKSDGLLGQIRVIWPVSNSLCYSYIQQGCRHADKLLPDHLSEWVRQLLFWYEKGGLNRARSFMADIEENYFAGLAGEIEARLETVRPTLLPFIRGVSGCLLDLRSDSESWTDGKTIYLPEKIEWFPSAEDNRRFYAFLACVQWGYLALGTLSLREPYPEEMTGDALCRIERLLAEFPDPDGARLLFQLLEFGRVFRMLAAELPGLVRKVKPLLEYLLIGDEAKQVKSGNHIAWLRFLAGLAKVCGSPEEWQTLPVTASREESCRQLRRLYARVVEGPEPAERRILEAIMGRLCFDKVRQRQARARKEDREVFVQKLATLIRAHSAESKSQDETQSEAQAGNNSGSQAVVTITEQKNKQGRSPYRLKVDAAEVDMPPDLVELISRIRSDFGELPESYVQAAAGVAGHGTPAEGGGGPSAGGTLPPSRRAIYYDEWDYRRQGYRKNWCALYERELPPVRSLFVTETLERYRGVLSRLRRQFESLRSQHRFIRRQRYGDDVDFDALVEAMGDRSAGLTPSERLFIRLLREERNIAVLFLVDMSNSTEGWVGKAIKEALVLLSDVLEIVGDRYGIYGFSGMRRSRCDLFRIKRLEEPCTELVRERICAIMPKEYTRMGPPIRHLAGQLLRSDAKVRLLITLSDGKPEDYDDYNGSYAIEDTRKALIEARGKGIIGYCITIDKKAHEYLAHMYGQGNYMYIREVEKLPLRMPEIYRLLTS